MKTRTVKKPLVFICFPDFCVFMKSVIRKGGFQKSKISAAAILYIISTIRLERLYESFQLLKYSAIAGSDQSVSRLWIKFDALMKFLVRRQIKHHHYSFQECFEKLLVLKPNCASYEQFFLDSFVMFFFFLCAGDIDE